MEKNKKLSLTIKKKVKHDFYDEDGNKLFLDFSFGVENSKFFIIGDLYKYRTRYSQEKYIIKSGDRIKDLVLREYPNLKLFYDLMGCDLNGIPKFFRCCIKSEILLCEYNVLKEKYNLSDTSIEVLSSIKFDDDKILYYYLNKLGFFETRLQMANDAINYIEEINDMSLIFDRENNKNFNEDIYIFREIKDIDAYEKERDIEDEKEREEEIHTYLYSDPCGKDNIAKEEFMIVEYVARHFSLILVKNMHFDIDERGSGTIRVLNNGMEFFLRKTMTKNKYEDLLVKFKEWFNDMVTNGNIKFYTNLKIGAVRFYE